MVFSRRKSSAKSQKDLFVEPTFPEPVIKEPEVTTATKPAPAPAPAPAPVVKKVEPKKVPSGPKSIVPPNTKRVLVVGKYVVMTADVDKCDAVIVQGNLDGFIKAKYIVIMKGGCMRGKVECKEADIAGSFEGVEMTTHHRLTLSSTARVGGKTTYNRISVEDGAVITGDLVYKPVPEETPAAKPVVTSSPSTDDDAASVRSQSSPEEWSSVSEEQGEGRMSHGDGQGSGTGGEGERENGY